MNNRRQLLINLAAIYLSIFFSSAGFGVMLVLISLTMNRFVVDEILISISSSAQILAGILFARYLPIIVKKFGAIKTIQVSSLISAFVVLLTYQYFGYFAWLIIMFIFGISSFAFFVIRQSITLDIAPKNHKALIVAIGGMLIAIGNSCGAAIPGFIKDDALQYFAAAALYVIAMLPMLWFKSHDYKFKQVKKIGLWRYIKISPKVMFGGFIFNYIHSSCLTFLIIYGLRSGMSVDQSSLLLSFLLLGTVFSIPLGYITDRVNRRFLILVANFICLNFAIALFFVKDPSIMAILLFLLFGFLIGIKLPALVLINEKYKPTQRLAVNSAFNKFCLIGNIFGIFLTGALINIFAEKGLWISIIGILSLYLFLNLTTAWRRLLGLSPSGHLLLRKHESK